MKDKDNDSSIANSRARRKAGPDPLASLIRNAGPMPEPSAKFKETLHRELKDAWQQQIHERRQRRRRMSAGIAAVLAFVVIGFQFLQPDAGEAGRILRAPEGLQLSQAGTDGEPARAGETVLAGSYLVTGDLPAALELGAGFNVRLDAHTRVVVKNGAHLGLESGRVYVDSGRSLDGLVIDTPFGAVRDIGTQFAVALRPEKLTVQVRDGLVKLGAAAVIVAPGQRLHLDESGKLRTEQIALSGDAWSWVETVAPRIVTEGRSLHAFLEAVQQQTGLQVRYATPEIERRAAATIIGGRHPDLPPRQLLEVVLSATNFRHAVTESTIVISGRESPAAP